MIIVADTSALVALAACDELSLLDQLFQDVRIPPAVFRECTVPGKPDAERLEAYLHDKLAELDVREFVIAVAGLGQGELEAMALYKILHADHLLIDDAQDSALSMPAQLCPGEKVYPNQEILVRRVQILREKGLCFFHGKGHP